MTVSSTARQELRGEEARSGPLRDGVHVHQLSVSDAHLLDLLCGLYDADCTCVCVHGYFEDDVVDCICVFTGL